FVRVFDAAGCSAQSQPVTVSIASPSATITPSGPTTFCAGGNVTLSAPAGYSYSWSNGATTQSITVNQTNTYTVTVNDANGCTAACHHHDLRSDHVLCRWQRHPHRAGGNVVVQLEQRRDDAVDHGLHAE